MRSETHHSKYKVLVIHALRPTSRKTTIDHLLCFREFLKDADVQYLHFLQPLPNELKDVEVDLLIINYDFLNYRFTALWPFIKRRNIELARRARRRVAVVQDDFWGHKLLDQWCLKWQIDRVLTSSEEGWEFLYPRSSRSIEIQPSLNGYAKAVSTSELTPFSERTIDVGQRVREMPAHVGRLGLAKAEQARRFSELAREAGFVVDVSTRVEDSFLGDDWLSFLGSCRFTLGMKGGASMLDPYGLIHTKVESYIKRHSTRNFDEIEKACFAGKDMKHQFVAVSPRMFEAASVGTCQILSPADYLGVLEPWKHYIPLEEDMSNSSSVLSAMRDLERCEQIAESAHKVLVESGQFDYSRLVKSATEGLLGDHPTESEKWQLLVDHLRSARELQGLSVELHDAMTQLMIAKSCDDGNALAMSSSAVNYLMRKMKELQKEDWFQRHLEIARRDPDFSRSVWVWRDPSDIVW